SVLWRVANRGSLRDRWEAAQVGCRSEIMSRVVLPRPAASAAEDRSARNWTANRLDSRRSRPTLADRHKSSTCADGQQRTTLDGRGRVRSSLVTPPAWARVWPANDGKRPVSHGQQR